MKKKMCILLLSIFVVVVLLYCFGVGEKRTDVVLTGFNVAEDGKSIHLKVTVASSVGYTKYMHVKQGGDDKWITFYSTFGINNKIGAKNKFDIEVNDLTGDIYFYNGDGGYTKVLEKDETTNEWKIPNSESESKEIISDAHSIEISVLDENSLDGINYKENYKITDQGLILEITSKINDSKEYPEFENDFGAGGFFEGCPIIEIYDNHNNKQYITVCDDFSQDKTGEFFNLMMVWSNEDGSDKKIYKANQKLESYIKEIYEKYELEIEISKES